MKYKEVTEEEYEKEMINWYETLYKEIKEKEKRMEKERHEEKIEEKRNKYSFASFFYEKTYICHSKIKNHQVTNSTGLTKDDYDMLENIRKNDPNMFDRMAVK